MNWCQCLWIDVNVYEYVDMLVCMLDRLSALECYTACIWVFVLVYVFLLLLNCMIVSLFVAIKLGISSIFDWPVLACSSFWKDAIWSSTALYLLPRCISGLLQYCVLLYKEDASIDNGALFCRFLVMTSLPMLPVTFWHMFQEIWVIRYAVNHNEIRARRKQFLSLRSVIACVYASGKIQAWRQLCVSLMFMLHFLGPPLTHLSSYVGIASVMRCEIMMRIVGV